MLNSHPGPIQLTCKTHTTAGPFLHLRTTLLVLVFVTVIMGNKPKVEVLQAEVDEDDQSFFRLRVDGRAIKYLTVEPGLYSAEDMCFGPSLLSRLPDLPLETGMMGWWPETQIAVNRSLRVPAGLNSLPLDIGGTESTSINWILR